MAKKIIKRVVKEFIRNSALFYYRIRGIYNEIRNKRKTLFKCW